VKRNSPRTTTGRAGSVSLSAITPIVRKGAFVTPAIGASTTGATGSNDPILTTPPGYERLTTHARYRGARHQTVKG